MLAKIHHYVSMDPGLAFPLTRQPYLNSMPIDIFARTRRHHVIRLSTLLEILDGQSLADIPLHRIITYTYQMLSVSDAAINGATGKVHIDHKACLLRPDLDSNTVIRLKERNNSRTLAEILLRECHATIQYPRAPLIQFDIGKRDLYCPLEQVWLQLPHDEHQSVQQEQNLWEIMSELQRHPHARATEEPQYIPRSVLTPTDNEASLSDSEVDPYEDGVWSSDEDENASFSPIHNNDSTWEPKTPEPVLLPWTTDDEEDDAPFYPSSPSPRNVTSQG
ncbi:hypothetical protein Aduo_004173 [Ancylostoma duodenale]